uniref:Uncharacterized protein n=1 Tax=Anguilla anguilla TaxID=7936 RepID=A0A0E9SA22_ANGAN
MDCLDIRQQKCKEAAKLQTSVILISQW